MVVQPGDFANAVADPGRVTINVHVPFEGSIPGTELSIPYNRIAQRAPLELDPGIPLAVYCRTGNMSAEAVTDLLALGFDDVLELEGGMVAWEGSGRPLDDQRP